MARLCTSCALDCTHLLFALQLVWGVDAAGVGVVVVVVTYVVFVIYACVELDW